jgi:hypothetical protein
MLNMSNVKLEVWIDGARDVCAFHADRPGEGPGLRYVWFILDRAELESAARGTVGTFEDGYHKLAICGERWTFYDFWMPTGEIGEIVCPYVNVEFPRTFVRALLRLAKKTWRLLRAHAPDKSEWRVSSPRVEIAISPEHAARVVRLYGQGKGRVRVEYVDKYGTEPGTAEKEIGQLADVLTSERDRNFGDMFRRVQQIAQNATRGFHQTATLRIANDSSRPNDWRDGFYWSAHAPDGRCVMNGGIINHSRTGGHDWSIHT